jgi:hypothetical protein
MLNDVYASWEGGDLPTTLSFFAVSLVFAVHSAPSTKSLIGVGMGRDNFGFRAEEFLRKYEVEEFRLQQATPRGIWVNSRVAFRYRHRANGWYVDSTMRHKWRFVGDEIAQLDLYYDAPLMHAFYEMADAV